jgi:iron complex transport system substrate-binding protein
MQRWHRAALVLGLVLAGCGDGGDTAAGTDGTTTTTATTGAAGGDANPGPITIEHRFGTTTLEAPPQRIVSIDNQWTDVLVALDAPLVGAALDPVVEGGRFPWQDVIPESVEGIPVTDAIPFEAVAALRPDLIVITWAAPDAADYERLSAIAPTIPLLGDEEVDAWEDIAAVAGEVLGIPDRAAALVDEADQRSADLLASLPGLEGKTYAMANYVPGDAIYVIADPDDGSARLFGRLGLSIDPDLLAIADGASGRVELSLERIDELDADLLVLLTNGADPADIPGYTSLPAVESGAVAILDLAAVSGLNTPSPLSIPYSLEAITPALEAAAAG